MATVDIALIAGKPCYEKLYRIPAVYYSDWLRRFGGDFEGKKVLDFGCGEGLATIGLSIFCGAEEVLGVDIGRDFDGLRELLEENSLDTSFPKNVLFRQIQPCEDLGVAQYDVIVSWSVLEHVAQDIFDEQLDVLVRALKPNGYCLFQVAPLYYAPYGSHLFGLHEPWGHLTRQTTLLRDAIYEAHPGDSQKSDWFWNCFITLNRFTASEFLLRLKKSRLTILNVYETYVNDTPPSSLTEIFSKDVLTKEQILVVCRKDSN